MADYRKLLSIFRMMQPIDVATAETVGNGSPAQTSMISELIRILLAGDALGTYGVVDVKKQLEDLRIGKNTSASNADGKKFDSLINYYSTVGNGGLGDGSLKYPYTNCDGTISQHLDGIIGNADEIKKKRNNKEISMCMVNTPFISPGTRDAEKVEFFLNYMPSFVLSRCMPYLEFEFVFSRFYAPETSTKSSTASLLKFLIGGSEIDPTSPDGVLYKSKSYLKDTKEGSAIVTTSGMELFTSPQSLINMDDEDSERYVSVIDKTRPFASLESVSINVTTTVGTFSFKTAQAVIKLHDRSRLNEIADLIQPGSYVNSVIWLTYGWRYPPDFSSEEEAETYAEFINDNMLVKEAYGISNSSFSFDAVGQVTITLQLYTLSAQQLKNSKIDQSEFDVLNDELKQIAKVIHGVRERNPKVFENFGSSREVRPTMLLDAAENGTFPDFKLKDIEDTLKSMHQHATQLTETAIPKEDKDLLMAQLDKFYKTTSKTEGGIKSSALYYKEERSRIAMSYVQRKFDQLHVNDPFIISDAKNKKMKEEIDVNGDHPLLKAVSKYMDKSYDIDPEFKKKFPGAKKQIVSFGKLFSVFMGTALASANSSDEYQIIFYNLNDLCGYASRTNIAEFPIELSVFMAEYKKFIEENKLGENITVEQFIEIAINSQFSDYRAPGYGLLFENIYKKYVPGEKEKNQYVKKPNKTDQTIADEAETAHLKINGGKGSFVIPQIELYIECVQQKPLTTGGKQTFDILSYYESQPSGNRQKKSTQYKRITKIHIHDKTATPYKAQLMMLKSGGPDSGGYRYHTFDNNKFRSEIDTYVENQKRQLESTRDAGFPPGTSFVKWFDFLSNNKASEISAMAEGVLIKDTTTINSNADIKRIVSNSMPSIIYGTNASSVLEASLSTKQDSLLATNQMKGHNAGLKNVNTPAGGAAGELPLVVIPASLTLRTLGCPLIQYMQMFFVDFNTGTTLDNIYAVTGLTHSITPGKFDTSLTMSFQEGYASYQSARSAETYIKESLAAMKRDAKDVPEKKQQGTAPGKK